MTRAIAKKSPIDRDVVNTISVLCIKIHMEIGPTAKLLMTMLNIKAGNTGIPKCSSISLAGGARIMTTVQAMICNVNQKPIRSVIGISEKVPTGPSAANPITVIANAR